MRTIKSSLPTPVGKITATVILLVVVPGSAQTDMAAIGFPHVGSSASTAALADMELEVGGQGSVVSSPSWDTLLFLVLMGLRYMVFLLPSMSSSSLTVTSKKTTIDNNN